MGEAGLRQEVASSTPSREQAFLNALYPFESPSESRERPTQDEVSAYLSEPKSNVRFVPSTVFLNAANLSRLPRPSTGQPIRPSSPCSTPWPPGTSPSP